MRMYECVCVGGGSVHMCKAVLTSTEGGGGATKQYNTLLVVHMSSFNEVCKNETDFKTQGTALVK
jgi:hypothetical protein